MKKHARVYSGCVKFATLCIIEMMGELVTSFVVPYDSCIWAAGSVAACRCGR